MIKDARFCKKCQKYTKNFQKAGNVWCLDCRQKAFEDTVATYKSAKKVGPPFSGNLFCNHCGKKVWETYTPANLCADCALKVKTGKISAVSVAAKILDAVVPLINKPTALSKPMQKGEVRRLPKNSSPLWTDQWAVQGSAKAPYIVSHKKDSEWQCSCKAWTTTVPREDCKHILKVKLTEKILIPSVETNILTKKTTVISVETADTKKGLLSLTTFNTKGRKFR